MRKKLIALFAAVVAVSAALCTVACNKNNEPPLPERLTLNKTQLSLLVGEDFILVADAGDFTLEWSSSAPAVAEVDSAGRVIALAEGSATITATVAGSEVSASCAVSVTDGGGQRLVRFDYTQKRLVVGESFLLTATPYNDNGDLDDAVVWDLPETDVAELSTEGNALTVKAISEGRIVVSAAIDGAEAQCEITVVSESAIDPANDLMISPAIEGDVLRFKGYSSCEYTLYIDGVKTEAVFDEDENNYSLYLPDVFENTGDYDVSVGYTYGGEEKTYYSAQTPYSTPAVGKPDNSWYEINSFESEYTRADAFKKAEYSSVGVSDEVAHSGDYSLKITITNVKDMFMSDWQNRFYLRNRSLTDWSQGVTKISWYGYLDGNSFVNADTGEKADADDLVINTNGAMLCVFPFSIDGFKSPDTKLTASGNGINTWIRYELTIGEEDYDTLLRTVSVLEWDGLPADEVILRLVFWNSQGFIYPKGESPGNYYAAARYFYSFYVDDFAVYKPLEAAYSAQTDKISFTAASGCTYKLLSESGAVLEENFTADKEVSTFVDAAQYDFATDVRVKIAEYKDGDLQRESALFTVATTSFGANELNGFDSAATSDASAVVFSGNREGFSGDGDNWRPWYVDSPRYGSAGNAAKITLNALSSAMTINQYYLRFANKTGADWSGITSVSWYVYIDSASVKNTAGESAALPFDVERLLKGWWWYAGATIGTTSVTVEAADGGAVAADKWVKCTLNIDPAAYDFFFPTIDGQRMFRLYCWNCAGRLPEAGNWFSNSGYGFTFYLDAMTFSVA